jgi:Alpha galactosidase A/Alpha galactosidase C-terminal beta sandwich domain
MHLSFGKSSTRTLFITLLVMLLNAGYGSAQANAPLAKIPLPPLAWSSWNSFSNTIDSEITMHQARAMVSSGLQKAGYEYVNIDEGWWLGDRDAAGNFIVDPKRWPAIAPGDKPGDMANIVRYIHSLGLKAGIYTDAGKDGCSMFPDIGPAYADVGSEGHYEQDFLQFAQWGFDFVKVDWCGGNKENLSADVQYGEIARAIARAEQISGKRLYYSICDWGKQSPWTWGPGVGGSVQDVWRVSGDIVAPVVASGPHTERKAAFDKMMQNFDEGIHPEAQHTGYYNDPDMMVLGMPGFNAEQNRLHMALWVVSGAPLIIGADVTKLDAETLDTLRNSDALAIDQDPLGLQCIKVKELSHGLEIWSKFLATPGSRAVLLLNRTYFPAPLSVEWSELGLKAGSASVREVWANKDLGADKDSFQATVPAQDAVLLMVHGSEGPSASYLPLSAKSDSEKGGASSETVFSHVTHVSSPFAQIRIVYANEAQSAKVVGLYVNGEAGTRVAFPPTKGGVASVWIQAKLDRQGDTNKLTFDTSPASGLKIESIDVY